MRKPAGPRLLASVASSVENCSLVNPKTGAGALVAGCGAAGAGGRGCATPAAGTDGTSEGWVV